MAESGGQLSRALVLVADLAADLRFACRGLAHRALLSGIVIVTLAGAIGIGSGVFTLFEAAVLTPHVPFDPGSFSQVFVGSSSDRARPGRPGEATLDEYEALGRATSLRALVGTRRYRLPAGAAAEMRVGTLLVTCNFFDAYGAGRPLLGRVLQPDDCATARPVAVLDEGIWRAQFDASPAIVGSPLKLNGRFVTVVGIAPRATAQLDDPEIWVPFTLRRYLQLAPGAQPSVSERDERWLTLWGRLAPGVSRRQAASELSVLAAQHDRAHPGRTTTITLTDGSIAADPGKPLVIPLMALVLGSLACLLLIACANVATLLLAKADARQPEIAIRLSLGAGRGRLLRMLLVETLLLAGVAGGAAVYVARQVPILLFHWFGSGLPAYSLSPDWRAFAYLGATTLLAGVAAGLAPALESLRVDVVEALKGRRSVLGAVAGGRLRNGLIGVQVALSFVLLTGAGLFAITHYRIVTGEPGFEAAHLLIARAPAAPAALGGTLAALPGARIVAFARTAPMFTPARALVSVDGAPARDAGINEVSPEYFHVVGLSLVRGRLLGAGDATCAAGSCQVVVSEAFVRDILPPGDPTGRIVRTAAGAMTIVGVVRDASAQVIGQPDPPIVYAPWTPSALPYQALVRFDGDPAAFSRAAADALRRAVPGAIVDARTARWYVEAWLDEIGPIETLILALAGAAAGLAVIGVFGLVSFSVSRRTREFGVRIALGARPSEIYRIVLGSAVKPAALGLAAGVALAAGTAVAFANVLARLHFAVSAKDPLTYVCAAAVLSIVIVAALAAPARRAARVDPISALRWE